MKYHGFDSPLDWSQHLIQKADLHEYEPSEPGKRVETLLKKTLPAAELLFLRKVSSMVCGCR